MEKQHTNRLTASEAKSQTPVVTTDEILKAIDECTKNGDSIHFIHPAKYISPLVLAELLNLGYKCYEFKDHIIGLNGLAIEWR